MIRMFCLVIMNGYSNPKICLFLAVLIGLFLVNGGQAQRPGAPLEFKGAGGFNSNVSAVVPHVDGGYLVGGSFSRGGGKALPYLTRIDDTGSADETFTVGGKLNGPVRTIAVLEDGRFYIGGNFTMVNGVARGGIARLHPDGSLDHAFDPGAGLEDPGGSILPAMFGPSVITVESNGSILVVGEFTSADGVAVNRFARFHEDGSVDAGFSASGANVRAVKALTDGKILIGGSFTIVQGVSRPRLARLQSDGTLDSGFDALISGGSVSQITLIDDDKILVSGFFDSAGGQPRNNLVRINMDGVLDPGFVPDDQTDLGGAGFALDETGKIYISRISGMSAGRKFNIVRLLSGGELDSDYDSEVEFYYHPSPGRVGVSRAGIRYVSGGGILAFGTFTFAGEMQRPYLAKLTSAGTLDETFNPGGLGVVFNIRSMARDGSGRFIFGGDSDTFGTSINVTRYAADGAEDLGFPGKNTVHGPIYAVAADETGRVLIGGDFTPFAQGLPRTRVARLNTDGTLDESFDTGSGPNGAVWALLVEDGGTLLAAGAFTSIDGNGRQRIARLSSDGAVDVDFDAGEINGDIHAMLQLENKKIIIAGTFTEAGGLIRNRIARLHTDGSLDHDFASHEGMDSAVYVLAAQEDGRILAGGHFSTVDGVSRPRLARFHSDGSLDESFNPPLIGGTVYDVSLDQEGRIYLVGSFTSIGGIARLRIARLHPDGGLDLTFEPGQGASSGVQAILLDDEGTVWAGGSFTHMDGFVYPRLALLRGGDPAPQSYYAWMDEVALPAGKHRPIDVFANDGISNLQKYFHGVTPWEYAADHFPKMVIVMDDAVPGGRLPAIQFMRACAVDDVSVLLEGSTDLMNWTVVPHLEQVFDSIGNAKPVRVRPVDSPSTDEDFFMRLRLGLED